MNPNQKRAVAANTTAKAMTKSQAYDVIVQPMITEKALGLGVNNQVVFKVRKDATKPQIKKAVELLFDKSVVAVNTLNQIGKVKRFKGKLGNRPGYKKAIVTLKAGDTLDVTGAV